MPVWPRGGRLAGWPALPRSCFRWKTTGESGHWGQRSDGDQATILVIKVQEEYSLELEVQGPLQGALFIRVGLKN